MRKKDYMWCMQVLILESDDGIERFLVRGNMSFSRISDRLPSTMTEQKHTHTFAHCIQLAFSKKRGNVCGFWHRTELLHTT